MLPTLMPGAHISFGVVRKKGESARSAKVKRSRAASGGFSCSCITLMLAKLVPAPHAFDETRDKHTENIRTGAPLQRQASCAVLRIISKNMSCVWREVVCCLTIEGGNGEQDATSLDLLRRLQFGLWYSHWQLITKFGRFIRNYASDACNTVCIHVLLDTAVEVVVNAEHSWICRRLCQ